VGCPSAFLFIFALPPFARAIKTQVQTANLGHPPCLSTFAGIVEVISSPRRACQQTPTRSARAARPELSIGSGVHLGYAKRPNKGHSNEHDSGDSECCYDRVSETSGHQDFHPSNHKTVMASSSISFADLEWNLPLFEDLFLSMHGQNVMLVDFYLQDLERDLLKLYIEIERTPFPDVLIVSALNQMWIFALYELLRTWRQRVRDLKQEAQKVPVAPAEAEENESGLEELAVIYRKRQLKRLRDDAGFEGELNEAYDRIEPLFRRIEALRMNLAKHEVPKMKGVPALAPGYGRIDMMSGSMTWQVDLGNMTVDMVSRRSLADQLREIVIGGPTARERAAEAKKKQIKKDTKKLAAKERKKEEKEARKRRAKQKRH
jgi:hypothetical protein